MSEDDTIDLRRGVIMLPRYNKTIVALCDLRSMGFVHPQVYKTPWAPLQRAMIVYWTIIILLSVVIMHNIA